MAAWVDIDDESLSWSSNDDNEDEDEKDKGEHINTGRECTSSANGGNIATQDIRQQDICAASHIIIRDQGNDDDYKQMKPSPSTTADGAYRVRRQLLRSKIRQTANQMKQSPVKKRDGFVETARNPNNKSIAALDSAIISVQHTAKQTAPQMKLPSLPTQTEVTKHHEPNRVNFIIKMAPVLEEFLLNNPVKRKQDDTRIPHKHSRKQSKRKRNGTRTNHHHHHRDHHSTKGNRSNSSKPYRDHKKTKKHNAYHANQGRSKKYHHDETYYDYYEYDESYYSYSGRNRSYSKNRQFMY